MAAGPGSRSFARVSTVGRGREPGGRPGRSSLGWGRRACPELALAAAGAGDTGARRSVSGTAVPSLLAGGRLASRPACLPQNCCPDFHRDPTGASRDARLGTSFPDMFSAFQGFSLTLHLLPPTPPISTFGDLVGSSDLANFSNPHLDLGRFL